MLSMNKISTNSDLVSFIVFKRQLKKFINKIIKIFYLICFITILSFGIYHRQTIFNVCNNIKNICISIFDTFFQTKIQKIKLHLDKNSILDSNEINNILSTINGYNINKDQIITKIEELKSQNSLIDNVFVRKTIGNSKIDFYIKEKQIIAVLLSDNCDNEINCKKQLLTLDNNIITYHKIETQNLLKIYGNITNININDIKQNLSKYKILDKIKYLKFYTSERFDIILNNGLIIKLPRKNWENELKRFNKLDSEYSLSNEIQNIKYIDLRIKNKIYIGEK